MPYDELEPDNPLSLTIQTEAGKVPERAEQYFSGMNQTIGPVLKTFAVIGAGVVTVLGFLSIIGGRK